MARALVRSVRTFVKQPTPRGRHGKESEKSKEDCQGDQESRQEDQEDEEVSARFSASQSRRGIATTIAGELDASQDALAENAATIRPAPCADGPRSLRLMHMGPVFCVRSLTGSPVAPGVSRFPGLRLSALSPSFVERGGGGAPPALMRRPSFPEGRFAREAAVP